MTGFTPAYIGLTEQEAFYWYPCDNITVTSREALVLSAGHLIAATGTTKPQFFAVEAKTVSNDGDLLCVTPVRTDIIYETQNQANFTSVVLGDKVTLHTDGAQVTATETDGIATVVGFDAAAVTATGKKVLVKFE